MSGVMVARAAAGSLSASKGFGRYKQVTEKALRTADVEDDAVRRFAIQWARILENRHSWDYTKMRRFAKDLMKKGGYSAWDIAKFCIRLGEIETVCRQGVREEDFEEPDYDFPTRAGEFISALVNSCSDSHFLLPLDHLQAKLHRGPLTDLGVDNTKSIRIRGNVSTLGTGMKGGTIIVDGDAVCPIAFGMSGGRIVINGKTSLRSMEILDGFLWGPMGRYTGPSRTLVELGEGMSGGEIHLNGKVENPRMLKFLGEGVLGGKVFREGRLVFER